MTDDEVAKVAAGLTPEQVAWVMSAPVGEQPCSMAEYENAPEFYVQFSPDEFCPETGCYLGGGERFWFASGTMHSPAGNSEWQFKCGLNARGEALRQHLQETLHDD